MLRPAHFARLLPFLSALFLLGCDRPRGEASRAADGLQTFAARGVLREVSPDGRRARISHEAIAGYMEAMTMEFDLGEDVNAAALHPGDALSFRLCATERRGWIDQVRKIDAVLAVPPVVESAAAEPRPAALPECPLVDETGRPFRLSDYAGEPLAISFIFTRCPFPNFCPLLNQRLEEAARALPADRRWHLFSITLDPEYDTPERLAAYAQRYTRDPQRWTFATGARDDLRQLGAAIGLVVSETAALPEHNLRTVVVDPAGRVRKILSGNEWTAAELSTELTRP